MLNGFAFLKQMLNLRCACGERVIICFSQLMNEDASRAVRTKALRVKCLAKVRLVLWMTIDILQVVDAMSKLTFVAIFALATLAELPTQLGLVSPTGATCLLIKLLNLLTVD